MSNRYWDDRGRYNEESKALQALIPMVGAVPYRRTKNQHLERFRKVMNAYYDLYNNGLVISNLRGEAKGSGVGFSLGATWNF